MSVGTARAVDALIDLAFPRTNVIGVDVHRVTIFLI
jgi:hypothetical protein